MPNTAIQTNVFNPCYHQNLTITRCHPSPIDFVSFLQGVVGYHLCIFAQKHSKHML